MRRKDAVSQLRDLIDLLDGADLARFSNAVVEAPCRLNDVDVISVTSARFSGVHTGPLGADGEDDRDFFFSPLNYIASIRAGDYAVVLKDGALLQIRYDFQDDDLVGHRLCYFPMPCDVPEEYLDEFELGDIVEMVFDEPRRLRARSPLRFDFSAYDTSDDPTVHLHLVNDKGRVPVFGPLALGHFIDLVFRTFYLDDWNENSFLQQYRPNLLWRTIEVDDEKALHISCRH